MSGQAERFFAERFFKVVKVVKDFRDVKDLRVVKGEVDDWAGDVFGGFADFWRIDGLILHS